MAIIWRKRRFLSSWTIWWLGFALAFTVLAELSFTRYVSVYGTFNALGHVFKFLAYASMFRIVMRNMLDRPMQVFGSIVPIRAGCKAVRVGEDQWLTVEEYLTEGSGRLVSHGLCPKCCEKIFPQGVE